MIAACCGAFESKEDKYKKEMECALRVTDEKSIEILQLPLMALQERIEQELRNAKLADTDNPNLTDGGQHSLFQAYMRDVYREFFDKALDLKILKPASEADARIELTGYPQGLPSWEIQGGADALKDVHFWKEYDEVLKGFIDFYRSFFSQVSSRNAPMLPDVYFPEQVESVLLFNNDFMKTAKKVRDHCIVDAKYANAIRWQPAFKQLIYRNDAGQADRHHQPEFDRQRDHRTARRGGEPHGGCGGLWPARARAARAPAGSAPPADRGRSGRRHRHGLLAEGIGYEIRRVIGANGCFAAVKNYGWTSPTGQ